MSNEVERISALLGETVARLAPSVLRIEGRRVASGVVLDAHRVLTVAGAVAGLEEVRVTGADGQVYTGKVLGWDLSTDLGWVEVQDVSLVVPDWSEAVPSVGNIVLLLGRPGNTVEATWGLVRAVDGPWQSPQGAKISHWLDVDASFPRGFPGGPLIGMDGRVIGLNSRHIVRGGSTIPTATLQQWLRTQGSVPPARPGYLGVSVHLVELAEGGHALIVLKLDAGGPAEQAGILQGDLLLSIDETPLNHPRALVAWLQGGKAGVEAVVQLRRGGQVQSLKVILGARAPEVNCCP